MYNQQQVSIIHSNLFGCAILHYEEVRTVIKTLCINLRYTDSYSATANPGVGVHQTNYVYLQDDKYLERKQLVDAAKQYGRFNAMTRLQQVDLFGGRKAVTPHPNEPVRSYGR